MKKTLISFLAAAILILVTGCDKKNDNQSGTGRLVVKVTDAPFEINRIESATVTITKAEIRRAGESDGSPFIVLSEDTVTYNLLELRNGLTEELANLEIPAGEYDLIRLYVAEAGLMVKDYATPFKVKVPSGEQTGIKIFIEPNLKVEGGLTSELLLDFDLEKSFELRGNLTNPGEMKGFIFKPVIRAANLTTTGRIEGLVTDTLKAKIRNAKVWISQDTVFASAYSDTIGFYKFIGIPAGNYSIFASKDGYDTISYEIKVTEGNRTIQNFILPEN